MSHLTKMKTKISDKRIANIVAEKIGWSIQRCSQFVNSWSNEKVTNCDIYKNSAGQVKMVVDKDGNVIVDPYFMGGEYRTYMRDYTVDLMKHQALLSGKSIGMVTNTDGSIILEVS